MPEDLVPGDKVLSSGYNKAYYDANADHLRAYKRAWRAANRDRDKAHRLKSHYGLTMADYNQMLNDQMGLCANPGCSNGPPPDRLLDVDHDHSCCPGKRSCGKCIRGLLCRTCNQALGSAHDDIQKLQGLITYLETRSGRNA